MNIIVCIKQVPNVAQIRIDPESGTLIREGVPSIINPDDKHALEAALTLKEKHGGKITVLTMGPPQAEEALREALGMGVDEAILLSDRAFGGADTPATSYTIGMAVKKLGDYDLVICGQQSSDGWTAQVGPQLAEFLELPQITYAEQIDVADGTVTVHRGLEDGYQVVQAKMPALLAVTREGYEPRIPPMNTVIAAFREKEIAKWDTSVVEVDKAQIGLKGSPTRIKKAFTPKVTKGEVKMIEGSTKEIAKELAALIKEMEL